MKKILNVTVGAFISLASAGNVFGGFPSSCKVNPNAKGCSDDQLSQCFEDYLEKHPKESSKKLAKEIEGHFAAELKHNKHKLTVKHCLKSLGTSPEKAFDMLKKNKR